MPVPCGPCDPVPVVSVEPRGPAFLARSPRLVPLPMAGHDSASASSRTSSHSSHSHLSTCVVTWYSVRQYSSDVIMIPFVTSCAGRTIVVDWFGHDPTRPTPPALTCPLSHRTHMVHPSRIRRRTHTIGVIPSNETPRSHGFTHERYRLIPSTDHPVPRPCNYSHCGSLAFRQPIATSPRGSSSAAY